MKQTASIIYWDSSLTKEEIEKLMRELEKKGAICDAVTREYDDEWEIPTWYIP